MTRDADIERLNLPQRYTTALADAVAFIRERYQPIGIVVAGTIIRGTPDATSDFDIVVAHEPHWRQRCQRSFRGVPAEIFVNPVFQIRRAFQNEAAESRPVLAHMIATGVILHDPDGIMATLKPEAQAILDAGPRETDAARVNARYMIATWFEDAEDIRERDPDRASGMLIDAVLDAIRFHFRQSGRWHPREKDLLRELDEFDPELGALARQAMRASTIDDRVAYARSVVERVVGATGFFEWESPREPLVPDSGTP
jgi:hypothetical protein